jgi:hypothetical protein
MTGTIYKATRDAGVMNAAAAEAPKAVWGCPLLCSRGTFSEAEAMIGGSSPLRLAGTFPGVAESPPRSL